jgi:hypothetical protein
VIGGRSSCNPLPSVRPILQSRQRKARHIAATETSVELAPGRPGRVRPGQRTKTPRAACTAAS